MKKIEIQNRPFYHFFVAVGGFFLNALLAKWLWNLCLVPAIGVKEVGYWQTVGIVILFTALTKGFVKTKVNNNTNTQEK